ADPTVGFQQPPCRPAPGPTGSSIRPSFGVTWELRFPRSQPVHRGSHAPRERREVACNLRTPVRTSARRLGTAVPNLPEHASYPLGLLEGTRVAWRTAQRWSQAYRSAG